VSAHAIYSPSSAHRWMACTASASAIAQLGEQEEGDEAAEGTRAHDEIERCLGPLCETKLRPCRYCSDGKRTGLPENACSECMNSGVEHENALPVNPAHPAAHGVALVLSYVEQLQALPGPSRMWVEQRVRLTDQIWGRCDVAHWQEETATLTIVDYKNGYVDVQAEQNEQLMIYAAASIFTHNLPAKWIRLAVVQPRSFLPVPRVKQWVCSVQELRAFAERAAAVPTGPLTFTAGEQCKYCPMFGRCPASADVLTRLGVVLANAPADVPAAQVAIFKACEKPIADFFKNLDKAATKRALAGEVPPGMKLVTSQKHRAWKDEAAARAAVLERFGVTALNPPTPAQAETLGLDVSSLADKPDGGPVLAFESDTRKAYERKSAADMFRAAVAQQET